MAQEPNVEANEQDMGDTLHAWQFPEYIAHERSRVWYIVGGVILIALIAYSILAQHNFLFALILIMIAAIVLVQQMHEPLTIQFTIAEKGIRLGNSKYLWRDLEHFWILDSAPHSPNLYITYKAKWRPHMVVPLSRQNPQTVRQTLLRMLPEDTSRTEESFLDQLGKIIKI